MPFRLFPKVEAFYDHFEAHARLLVKAANALKQLLEQYQELESQVKQIEDLEHDGDALVREISLLNHKTFVTPIDREDIHALISVMDDVLDYIQAAAVRFVVLGVKAPRPPAHALAELLVKATKDIHRAVELIRLDQDVTFHVEQIKGNEREGDLVNRKAVAALFHETMPEIEVLQWMAIYDRLETALDKCEDVAEIIEAVMLKNA